MAVTAHNESIQEVIRVLGYEFICQRQEVIRVLGYEFICQRQEVIRVLGYEFICQRQEVIRLVHNTSNSGYLPLYTVCPDKP